MSDDGKMWIDPAATAPVEGQQDLDLDDDADRIIVAKGQVALFPDQPDVTRWKDAESDPDHRPIDVGPNATCSCGWKGAGWVQHFTEVKGGK